MFSDIGRVPIESDVMVLHPVLPEANNASISAAIPARGESEELSQLKAIVSSFQDLICKFTATQNVQTQNDHLDMGVAQVWLAPPEGDLLRPSAAAANVCIEPPVASSSCLIPEACL